MAEHVREEAKKLKVGEKITALRKKMGLTVEELAEDSGLARIVISQIESDAVSPTIAALIRIAKALDKDVNYFFQEEEPENIRIEVVRESERKKVQRKPASGNHPLSYSYQSLSFRKAHKHMQPFLVEFDIDVDEEVEMLTHEGEEFLFLLQGKLEMHTDREVITLKEGDSVYFESSIPHCLIGKGSVKPKAVVAIYTPEKSAK
jgi:transcriptional regulator with XRE-family HTH domain